MSEITKRERRSTVEVGGEEAEENLLEENRNGSSTTARRKSGKSRKKSLGESLAGICKELYNAEYREFLSRDAKGWFKLAIFYFFFYTCLASFFILLLVLFFQIIDMKTPNYFYKESVMHYKGINPGLGFRPQVDIESELIKVDSTENKQNYQSLDLFLTKYERSKTKNFTAAHGKKYVYNYETHINGTPCSRDKHYGYLPNSVQPCVLLKLNRIYGWLPIHSAKMPGNLTKTNSTTDKFVYVKCEGEYGTDRDNIKQIEYYSAYPNHDIGGIPFKYFPYRNQPGYLSPLVWVYFKNVSMNVLVNVECKAYAKNIDNKDRLNRRGMTKFSLFISPSSSSKP